MKVLRHLAVLLVFIVLLSLGIALLVAALFPPWWEAAAGWMAADGRRNAGIAGGACLALALLLAATGVRRRRKAPILSFRNEGGTVSISTDAISDYLGKLVAEFPSVVKMRTKVIPARSAVDIVATLRVKAGPQIHEVCETLQNRIRETMVNGLGISEVRRIEVSVKEISSEHKDA